jgi:predicted AAA+ superfamily ATPase
LLARLAGQTAQLLNIRAVAEQVGLTPDTGENYTRLLEDVYLIHRLPAWGKTLRARAVASPKLHMVDSGLASRLLRLSAAKLSRPDPTILQQFGHLLETFVVLEVLKQASWINGVAGTGHWRTHDGIEVDLIVEFDDGRIVAVEVKAGGRVAGKDLNGLKALRDELGDAFMAGVALHTGPRSYSPQDRIHVMPVDRLWTPA